jgi:putative FmdB family regulatory protein
MPTYDYECKECGHDFEYFQSMSADPLRDCPQCGGEVRRLIGGGMGIIFKGSGFYVTDSRGGGGKSGGREHTPSEAAADSSTASAKSDNAAETAGGNSEKTAAASERKTQGGSENGAPQKQGAAARGQSS